MPVQLQSRSYHQLSSREVIEYYSSDAELGLTAEEVASLLRKVWLE
jgi:predicted alpha/beta-hydrolase family hydrolase